MAARKMTFTIPEALAAQFLKRIPARDRSRYVSEAIAARLLEREQRLIAACEAANRDPELSALESEWDALADPVDRIDEPWDNAKTR